MYRIKLFLDSADKEQMVHAYRNKKVSGFTTNPTLMRRSRVQDYRTFLQDMVGLIPDMPISFEVFSDELSEMEDEARNIASYGENIYVKIPITNTQGKSTAPILNRLSKGGISLNITAIFTLKQIKEVIPVLDSSSHIIFSIFAGRIANTGIDPMPIMKEATQLIVEYSNFEILWASPREALNLRQAEECGCDIITMTPSLIEATKNFGKNLTEYSLETVKMFYEDAQAANYVF